MIFYVVFESVTYAMKAKSKLEKQGLKTFAGRSRRGNSETCGSGYTLEVTAGDINKLRYALSQTGVRYKKIVEQESPGKFRDVRK